MLIRIIPGFYSFISGFFFLLTLERLLLLPCWLRPVRAKWPVVSLRRKATTQPRTTALVQMAQDGFRALYSKSRFWMHCCSSCLGLVPACLELSASLFLSHFLLLSPHLKEQTITVTPPNKACAANTAPFPGCSTLCTFALEVRPNCCKRPSGIIVFKRFSSWDGPFCGLTLKTLWCVWKRTKRGMKKKVYWRRCKRGGRTIVAEVHREPSHPSSFFFFWRKRRFPASSLKRRMKGGEGERGYRQIFFPRI